MEGVLVPIRRDQVDSESMAVSQGLVLAFILERGGKVRNSELLGAFRGFINSSEPEERRRNRDLFKNFVNSVAVVQQIDEVKYVVAKKKYQELLHAGERVDEPAGSLGSSLEASSSSCTTTRRSSFSKRESLDKPRADVLNNNNNSYFCSSAKADCCTGRAGTLPMKPQVPIRGSSDGDAGMMIRASQGDSLTATVLSVSNGRKGKAGAVFAVVAVKSPPPPPPPPHSRSEKVHSMRVKPPPKALDDLAAQQQLPCEVLPQPFAGTTAGSGSSCLSEGHLYRSLRTKRRHSVGPISPATKRGSRVAKDPALIPLELREHDWLVTSATGRWAQVCSLLLQDVELAEKRSFISGFTVLHWAAKKGNGKVVRQVLDVARQGGLEVDVNAKSHDGYTPLHVAAIHGHEAVLNLLVRIYRANCNVRDNSGKKPHHYLGRDVSPEVREMLGGPRLSPQVAEHGHSDEDRHFSDVAKGTFSKLFQHSSGQRKKPRRRPSFHFIRDDHDENRRDCTSFSRRPLH
ncbi:hypothetical protein NFI96_005269 [Prochilodus magdalenae]|nr:hypothetical protein NFI96_005269 [Prochilodus magdalenae]